MATEDTQDPRHTDEFLKGAYGLHDLESAMSFYEEWADKYDDQMEETLGYVAPRVMAELFADRVESKSSVVLDAGCGTGLTSHYLTGLGFENVDGLDITPKMLAVAEGRGIYRSLFEADLTKTLDLGSDSYDGIISSGTFTLGHVGPEAIPELVRVLRSGGVLGCSIHRDLWEEGGFAAAFADLDERAVMRPLDRVAGEFFTGLGDTALYCTFQKT